MPKIVDYEERRTEIALATLRVIQRQGIENTTIRAIAREGGFSSGALAHYFTDKEDVVGFAFDCIANRSLDRIEAKIARAAPGLARLSVPLEAMLPSNEELVGAVVSLHFWARAASNAGLRERYLKHYARWRGFVTDSLIEAQDAGEIAPAADVEDVTDILIAAIDGLCVSITLDATRFPKARRKRLVARMIDGLTERRVLEPVG